MVSSIDNIILQFVLWHCSRVLTLNNLVSSLLRCTSFPESLGRATIRADTTFLQEIHRFTLISNQKEILIVMMTSCICTVLFISSGDSNTSITGSSSQDSFEAGMVDIVL